MTTAAIILAAGRGTRAGGDEPKQWQMLQGRPVLTHALAIFAALPEIARTVLVLHPDDMDRANGLSADLIVAGAGSRSASVRNALDALKGTDTTRVLIHDGARPLVSAALVRQVLAALDGAPAAAPAVPVSDALWRGVGGFVSADADRAGLFRAQTPQGFHFDAICAAHAAGGDALDDVALVRDAGYVVAIVPGDEDNLKITFPGDLDRAERLLGGGMDVRCGNGYDVHAFCDGDHVMLCGVRVPHARGLLGHSDADVGMHALTDAIYGALAMGDIGRHFPPSDPQWKGAASHIFLSHAGKLAQERGYRIGNADVTLVCERPKIGPHAIEMASELARILKIAADRISVKATTSERLGFTGREEGIAALATVTLVKP